MVPGMRIVAWGAWVSLCLVGASACTDASPGADLPEPDPERIIVFFPDSLSGGSRGRVLGRGLPGAFPPDRLPPFIFLRSLPSTIGGVSAPVQPDGSFTFGLLASGREVLELAASTDQQGSVLGPSTFVQIPPAPFPPTDHICCKQEGASVGVCRPENNREELGLDPNDPEDRTTSEPGQCVVDTEMTGQNAVDVVCASDRPCVLLENQRHRIEEGDVTVTAPDADGRVTVQGNIIPNSLVRVENRRQNGIGIPGPVNQVSVVSDPDGGFRIENLPARGDDELVVQAVDINGFSTPTLSVFVPDPPLAQAALTEVWPVRNLDNRTGGFVGLRFVLTGTDGTGLCPDFEPDEPEQWPQYCLGGGLDYSMIRSQDATVPPPVLRASVARAGEEEGQEVFLCPAYHPEQSPFPVSSPACMNRGATELPTRGLEGDLRVGAESLVVLVDFTAASAMESERGVYLDLVADHLGRLQPDDFVNVVAFGPQPPPQTGFLPTSDLEAVQTAFRDLEDRVAPEGLTQLFEAVEFAGNLIRDTTNRPGRILLTAISRDASPPDISQVDNDFERAVAAVSTQGPVDPGIPVDVVGLNLFQAGGSDDLFLLLVDLAAFSGTPLRPGRVYQLPSQLPPSVFDLQLLLRDARGQYSGGFLMLYQMVTTTTLSIDSDGKIGQVRVAAQVDLGDSQVADVFYEGPLEFAQVIDN